MQKMEILFSCQVGSRLYGTNTSDSDNDIMSIYRPTEEEIILGRYKDLIKINPQKPEGVPNNSSDTDRDIISLRRFIEMLRDNKLEAIELLFAPPDMVIESKYGLMSELCANTVKILSRAIIRNAAFTYANYEEKENNFLRLTNSLKKFLDSAPDKDRLEKYWDKLIEICLEFSKDENLIKFGTIPASQRMESKILRFVEIAGKKLIETNTVEKSREFLEALVNRFNRGKKEQKHTYKAWYQIMRRNMEVEELITTGKLTLPRPAPERDLLLKIKLGDLPIPIIENLINEKYLILTRYKIGENEDIKNRYLDEVQINWTKNFR